jgi:YidC/Oxa1 family membrane protein insertase
VAPINFIINELFIPFLTYSYAVIFPNYGLAIMLLTLLIKMVFFPLTYKQFKSMKITKKLQPQVKAIQEKFKGDPKKVQTEMMRLWKENNANPFSGCLPSLIQLPVFISIFYAVKSNTFIEMLNLPGVFPGAFPFWLTHLSSADNTMILPIVIGLAMFWSQQMMTIDPKQKAIFMFMPFVMFFFSIKMPAGVLIYWSTSMIVSNIQQWMIMKYDDKKPSNKPEIVA